MSRPDAAPETATLVRTRFPERRFDHARVVTDGWDSLVVELDGAWIVRLPRRPEVGEWIEKELRLLPEVAPGLPVAIPRFELVSRDGLVCVVYRSIHGPLPARASTAGRGAISAASSRRSTASRPSAPVRWVCLSSIPRPGASGWSRSATSSAAGSRRSSTRPTGGARSRSS